MEHLTTNELQAVKSVLQNILDNDFETTDKESIPFSTEIKLVRCRIQSRIDKINIMLTTANG